MPPTRSDAPTPDSQFLRAIERIQQECGDPEAVVARFGSAF